MGKFLNAAAVVALLPGLAAADGILEFLFGRKTETPAAPAVKLPSGTHEASTAITVKGEKRDIKLQTFAVGSDNLIYALLGSDRYGVKAKDGEIQAFDAAGKKLRGWKVDFPCQAICCAPDGLVLAAGDGKLAAYDASGQVKTPAMELPFIKSVLGNSEKLKQRGEEARTSEIQSCEESLKAFKDRLDELKKVDEEKLTNPQKAELKQYAAMTKQYEKMLEAAKGKKAEDYVDQIASQIKTINRVAVNDKDLFVVCGELKGYGYAVWRMDRDFGNSKQIISGLRGCCGQMDIQCCGDQLIVAQNCDHNVGRYDRDGKKLGTFGKRADRDGSEDGFGGCCNPMNVIPGAQGRVLTADSEGIIRVFDKEGKPEGFLGSVNIGAGCKNVAIGVTQDGGTVFLCDLPGSKIHILTRKKDAPKGSN